MRLIVAGGGTGGHLFPGIAVVEELLERSPDSEVLFVGTHKGIEAKLVPELGYNFATIEISGIKTVGLLGAIRGALRIPGAISQSKKIIRDFRPDAVIGVGGYASGPLVLAASRMKLPCAILEQNSIPGMTNRILGKFVRKIFLSFDYSASYFSKKKSVVVGNPIRKQILESLANPKPPALASHSERNFHKSPLRVFAFGGSQGAVALNRMLVGAAILAKEEGKSLSIVHQCGERDLEESLKRYDQAGIEADCRAFISDMAAEYRKADVILSRSGATTIAEIGVVGKASILVPYPYAANNHQELNAQEMVDAGAALLIKQDSEESDSQRLYAALDSLFDNPEKLSNMNLAMQGFAKLQAASDVVDWLQAQKVRQLS